MRKIAVLVAVAGFASGAMAQSELKIYVGQPGPIADLTDNRFNLFVPDHGTILSFKAIEIDMQHTWCGDLTIVLTHKGPFPLSVVLLDRPGVPQSTFGNDDDMNGVYSFTDGGAPFPELGTAAGVVPPGTYAGVEPLSRFVNNDKFGDWSLHIIDQAGGDVGQVFTWRIIVNNIPGPGPLALIGLAGLTALRRRR